MNKKNLKNFLIAASVTIGICILLVACFVIGAKIALKDLKEDIDLSARVSTSNTSEIPRNQDIFGTGYELNSGVASTTDKATIFQFASSTNEVYWDTLSQSGTPLYGATPTKAFIVNSDLTTFEIYYAPENNTSTAEVELFVSNDAGCEIASSTLVSGVEWYPASPFLTAPTTTPSNVSVSNATTSITLSHDGSVGSLTAADEIKTSFTINTVNVRCIKVVAYNQSTTDSSLLRIKLIK